MRPVVGNHSPLRRIITMTKKRNWKSGCLKGFLIGITVLIFLAVGFLWMFKLAFGPIERTGELELNGQGTTLYYREIYNADLAGVFYDVTFQLLNPSGKLINIGSASFNEERWQSRVQLKESNGYLLLIIEEIPFAKLIITNPGRTHFAVYSFNPQELRNDPIWEMENFSLPTEIYTGSTSVIWATVDSVQVNFEYRTGHSEPFKILNQKIDYTLDTESLKLKTIDVHEPEEK